MFKTKVIELLETALDERSDLFLIDFSIDSENHIKVIIDGDNGVLVEDCIFISRAIEKDLDREEEDYSLEVMSAGAAAPMVHERQYKKNLKRTLQVRTSDEDIEGELTEVTDENITLVWKVREPKPVGKGKVTVKKEAVIPFQDIIEAKVMIKF